MGDFSGPVRVPRGRFHRLLPILVTGALVLALVVITSLVADDQARPDCPGDFCGTDPSVPPPSSVAELLRSDLGQPTQLIVTGTFGEVTGISAPLPRKLRDGLGREALRYAEGSTRFEFTIDEVLFESLPRHTGTAIELMLGGLRDRDRLGVYHAPEHGDRWLVALHRNGDGSYQPSSIWTAVDLGGDAARFAVRDSDAGFLEGYTPDALLVALRAQVNAGTRHEAQAAVGDLDARLFHAAVVTQDGVLIVGGRGGLAAGQVVLLRDGRAVILGETQIAVFDPTTSTITELDAPEGYLRRAQATLLESGRILLTGGCCAAGQPVASAVELDVDARVTIEVGSLREGRVDHTSTLLADGRVLIVGGLTLFVGDTQEATASVEVYDPSSRSFTDLAPSATRHWGHTSPLLADGTVLVLGEFESGQPAAEIVTP